MKGIPCQSHWWEREEGVIETRLSQSPKPPVPILQLPAVLRDSVSWTGWWQKCKAEVTKFTGVPSDELQLSFGSNLW